MFEIEYEYIDKATCEIVETQIKYTHGKKESQEICNQLNDNCDVNHYWRIGYTAFID